MTNDLVYGVGINDADYVVKIQETIGYTPEGKQRQKVIWRCPFYARWCDMLRRCYCPKFKLSNPTYNSSVVCREWLRFSNFKAWMETQDWEGKQLDKDILGDGSLYSPDTCVFVVKALNLFVMESFKNLGKYPSGVYLNKQRGKFYAQCKDPLNRNNSYLGSFDSPEEAHSAWVKQKLIYVEDLDSLVNDPRVLPALRLRYKLKAKASQDNLKEKIEELEEIEEIQNRYS